MNPTIMRWKNLHEPEGIRETIAWSDLFAEFSKRKPLFLGDREHPGWSPAELEPRRRALGNVRRVFAACLDYDAGESIDAAVSLWGGAMGMLHTTRKHLPDAPRFRVILPWSRPVSPFEHSALWKRISAHAGGNIDAAPKDPSRFWFTPGAYDPQFFQAILLEGEPLSPDEWLAKPDPEPARVFEPPRIVDPTAIERRASAYIARMPEAIQGSGGDIATWHVALVLVKGFSLSEATALRILESEYNPRCVPPWSRKELEHKIEGAAKARVPDGFKLDDRDDWQPRRYSLPPCPAAPEPEPSREPGEDNDEPESAPPAIERYGFRSMSDLMGEVMAELKKPRPRRGCRTGHHQLDQAIGGFRPGNVTVFGAKRGVGKSTYSNLVTNLALDDGRTVLLFAGEDSSLMYGMRFLAARADMNALRLRDLECDRSDWSKITGAIESAPKQLFFVRVDGRPVEWIAQAVDDIASEQQIDLVVVDYLQCLRPAQRQQDRRNEVTYVCKTLSNAIKRAKAAGLLLSQLKRTERAEPQVEDLKESGDIEDMAEHILLAWAEEDRDIDGNVTSVQRKIKLGKNKDGVDAATMKPVELPFNPRTAAFHEVKPEPDGYEDFFENERCA